ncbi:hypothetical protein [Dyadobacter sp. 3J3]|uniref:hypothetical protein n=1 Tax=Dyadobacter sp. 3J3 TaxID=2606600 RepID=UPI001357BF00|nr:hypothetical protein [Dyadobacter sp. 3J3]
METFYQIVVEMKALHGRREIGRFLISTDREFAFKTFNNLKGKTNVLQSQILLLNLLEIHRGSELIIESVACNLEELAENCKIITKDAFKFFNLEK